MSQKNSIEVTRTGPSSQLEEMEVVRLDEDTTGFGNTFDNSDHSNHSHSHGVVSLFYFTDDDRHKTSARTICISSLVCIFCAVLVLPILFNINYYQTRERTRDWGALYHTMIDINVINDTLREYSSQAHLAGSPRDYELAMATAEKLEEWGFETEVIEHLVLLPNPIYNSSAYQITLHTGPETPEVTYPFYALNEEAVIPEDPTSGPENEAAPPFCGYSAEGNITADVVYANYGRKSDFQTLMDNNITIAGKIVLVRYGQIFRGNKAYFAEKYGAVGVLIYSDPADIVKGPIYPAGPWKPPTSVQRGSVWIGDGDPSTPGWPSTPEAPHLNYTQAQDPALSQNTPLPKIPIHPLSYYDAGPILRAMAAGNSTSVSDFGSSWQGGVTWMSNPEEIVPYRVGGAGELQVQMVIQVNITQTPIWTVCGEIEGSKFPNRQVILGSHRDAWTMGAGDPISGTSTLLSVAHTLNLLRLDGWHPQRTVRVCSWDAEEQGLIGSIEYAQQFQNILSNQAIAYINTDIAVSGTENFVAAGTPQMNEFLAEILKAVPVSDSLNVWDMWPEQRLSKLGSGSDHVAFIHHLGIPSFDLHFEGQAYDSVYHSNYDSYTWMMRYADPDLRHHKALSEVMGRIALTLADSEILPFNYLTYADDLNTYVRDLQTQSESFGLNWVSLEEAIQNLRNASVIASNDAFDLEKRRKELQKQERELIDQSGLTQETNANIRREENKLQIEFEALNDRLILTERGMLNEMGLPGRPFFRHVVFAPSIENSYSGAGFPAISDAISVGDIDLAQVQIQTAAFIINAAAETLDGTY